MGVLAGGLSVIAGVTATGPRATCLVVAGVAVSAVLFLLGLLLLPGAAPTIASRLRRVLDGSAIGTCLFFAGWTFGVKPLSAVPPGAASREATTVILLVIVLSAALAAIALTAARAVRRRGSTLFCGGGAAVALVQQSTTAMLLLLGAGWSLALAAAAVWAAGPTLMWIGAQRSAEQMPALRREEAPSTRFPPTLPLVAMSAALGLFSAIYYVLIYGSWGVYTAMIATSAAGAVGTRGMFAALDVYRYTTRLHAQETRFLTTDALTGIPNRLRLRHRLDVERTRVEVGERCATLLVIDLDDFGNLDAVQGHDIADELLMEVARRLRVAAAPNDLAARLAGASFAVLTTSSPRQAVALAGRLRARLAEPYRPADTEPGAVHLTASIGVAECNAAASVDEMIRCAELAVSRAKEHGGDRVEHYDESLQLRVLRRQDVRARAARSDPARRVRPAVLTRGGARQRDPDPIADPRAAKLPADEASRALELLGSMNLRRHAHAPLLPRIWQLRHNMWPYDAAYVALAESLDAELVTVDAKLSGAPDLRCAIRNLRTPDMCTAWPPAGVDAV